MNNLYKLPTTIVSMNARAYLQLSRPLNLVVASIAVILAAALTHELSFDLVYAVFSVILITAGGNAINDYFDYDIDLINKPLRPLPAGTVTKAGAKSFAVIMMGAGSAVSVLINPWCALIAGSACVLLYWYARTLKNAGFIGNLTIAGLTGMAIVYGGLSVAGLESIQYAALFAALINLSREMVKDIEDYKGDRAGGARTLAITRGIPTASRLSTIPLLVLVAITPLPYRAGLYNIYYLVLITMADVVLCWCCIRLIRSPSIEQAKTVKSVLKAVMLLGMAALYIGMY